MGQFEWVRAVLPGLTTGETRMTEEPSRVWSGRRWGRTVPMKKTPLALGLGVVAGVVLAVAGMAIVDDDEPARAPKPSSSMTAATCEEIIPGAVLEAMGWKVAPASVEIDDFRCGRDAEAGSVTVNDTAVVAGESARADEAEKVFEEECGSLGEDAVRDPAWLEAEGATCLGTSIRAGRGRAELHLLTNSDEVVRIHVVMREPTTRAQLRAGLGELVRAAEAHY